MPRRPRSAGEVDQVRQNILEEALSLIDKEGFEGFSMRKLAGRLGVSVVTLYRFYESKDHLYLAVLTRGFQNLFQELEKAGNIRKHPGERLWDIARAYLAFGLEQANFYNLMFTWHVPKYQDYVGTPMEAAARHELEESQKVYLFVIDAAREFAETVGHVPEERLRGDIIFFWSTLHGYIAGVNNSLLGYMHEAPLSLRETIIDNLFAYFQTLVREYQEVQTIETQVKEKMI
ncbi:MAG: TetR/AcrR family transcriptional regulator [Desulfosudaceae bacterium]